MVTASQQSFSPVTSLLHYNSSKKAQRVSNQTLYKLCNEEPLSSNVAKQSWSMLAQSYAWTLTRPLRGHWTSPLLAHKPINPD